VFFRSSRQNKDYKKVNRVKKEVEIPLIFEYAARGLHYKIHIWQGFRLACTDNVGGS
jgi:hypothetical protein